MRSTKPIAAENFGLWPRGCSANKAAKLLAKGMVRSMETEIQTIKTKGKREIPARFTKRQGKELVILLPGLSYNLSMPLFFYTSQILAKRGADVLGVGYQYASDEKFQKLDQDKKLAAIKADGEDILKHAENLGEYERVTIIGKSLGTLSMGWSAPNRKAFKNLRLVWLTPSLKDTELADQIRKAENPSLILIGANDPSFNKQLMESLNRSPHVTVRAIPGVDHAFNHAKGVPESAQVLGVAMQNLRDWLFATDKPAV